MRGGITSVDLLQTFVSHRIQPLHQREMTMWMYLGPCCHDHPFSTELGDTDINTWIQKILAHGADQNCGSRPIPLREGVESHWVSLLKLTFTSLCQFLLLNPCVTPMLSNKRLLALTESLASLTFQLFSFS
jgi:hypothetical protein